MFGCEFDVSNTENIGTLMGESETIVDGMNFDFSNGMDENYSVDGLNAGEGTMLFTSTTYGRSVMNFAPGGGRTICSTPVLGGYQQVGENTHGNLFQHYLTFLVDPEAAEQIPSNLSAQLIGDDVYLDWNAPVNQEGLLGYNIYKNGFLLNTEIIIEAEFIEEDINYGIYSYWVTALYEGDFESYSSNHVTINYSDPVNGHAISFNGNSSQAVIADDDQLNPNVSITVEAWVKLSGLTDLPTIISKEDWSMDETGYILRIDNYINSNTPQFQIGTTSGWIAASAPSGSIPFDTWTHVAGTFDGTSLNIYINGQLQGTQPCSYEILDSPADLLIGCHSDDFINRNWNGTLDEVRLWESAHSETQIQEYMMNPLEGSEDGLIALWRMEEGSGTNAHDVTNNGHDATLTNIEWVEGYPMYYEHGTANGYITNIQNSEPVVGALVRLGDYQVSSGTDGFYTIDLPPGSYDVFCSHDDYETFIYDGTLDIIVDETTSVNIQLSPLVGTDDDLPVLTALHCNVPNPFNPTTKIAFSTADNQNITKLVVYNLKGQQIKILVNEILPAGPHSVIWDGNDDSGVPISSGVYLYRMTSGNFKSNRKMILIK